VIRWLNHSKSDGRSALVDKHYSGQFVRWFIHAGPSVWWTICKWAKKPWILFDHFFHFDPKPYTVKKACWRFVSGSKYFAQYVGKVRYYGRPTYFETWIVKFRQYWLILGSNYFPTHRSEKLFDIRNIGKIRRMDQNSMTLWLYDTMTLWLYDAMMLWRFEDLAYAESKTLSVYKSMKTWPIVCWFMKWIRLVTFSQIYTQTKFYFPHLSKPAS